MDANTGPHWSTRRCTSTSSTSRRRWRTSSGRRRTPSRLRQRYTQGVDSFNRLYVDPQTGFTRNATPGATFPAHTLQDSQASYATPLALDLFSDEMTIQAGPNAGKSYQEFATARLAEAHRRPGQEQQRCRPAGRLRHLLRRPGQQPALHDHHRLQRHAEHPPGADEDRRDRHGVQAVQQRRVRQAALPGHPGRDVDVGAVELLRARLRPGRQQPDELAEPLRAGRLAAVDVTSTELGITSDGGKGYQDFVLQPVPGGEFTKLEGELRLQLRPDRVRLGGGGRRDDVVRHHRPGEHHRDAVPADRHRRERLPGRAGRVLRGR